mgnify:CR=1 FL=1
MKSLWECASPTLTGVDVGAPLCGSVEEVVGKGGCKHGVNIDAASGLPGNGHIARIPSEGGNVVSYPFKGLDDIQCSVVPRIVESITLP